MSRSGFPSMTALLGLLAVAGYQHRDKIAEMLNSRSSGASGTGGSTGSHDAASGTSGGGLGSLLGGQGGSGGGLGGLLGSLTGGGGLGGLLGGGLGELDQHMRRGGRGDDMDSWVRTGPNRQVQPHDLEAALGPDVLADLEESTGLSRSEILARLSRDLPDAVDRYTPEGRIPDRAAFG